MLGHRDSTEETKLALSSYMLRLGVKLLRVCEALLLTFMCVYNFPLLMGTVNRLVAARPQVSQTVTTGTEPDRLAKTFSSQT